MRYGSRHYSLSAKGGINQDELIHSIQDRFVCDAQNMQASLLRNLLSDQSW